VKTQLSGQWQAPLFLIFLHWNIMTVGSSQVELVSARFIVLTSDSIKPSTYFKGSCIV
jgi:hypothetical protein